MANDFDDDNPDAPRDDKPTKVEEAPVDDAPFLSDAQFELDDRHTAPPSQWPKIAFGVVVAIGVVLGVMYVKGLGPFQSSPPPHVEIAPVAPPPVPAALPASVPALPPPPPPPIVPPSKPSKPAKVEKAGKSVGSGKNGPAKKVTKKATKKKKHK